jgi:S-adenosylmethionine hydrolase
VAAERPVITLLTDFGTADSYVAQMKGIILQKCPDAQIVDITHEIRPQDVFRAAHVLNDAYRAFPRGTIHIVVVDPGVGTQRRVLCLAAARQLFLAPDNGVLELVLRNSQVDNLVAVTSEWYFRRDVSTTFHGRDIFASVAAHLAGGVKLARLGPPIPDPVRLEVPRVVVGEKNISGAVIEVDRFGNLVTNVEKKHLARVFHGARSSQMLVFVAGREIRGLSRSYAERGQGELMCVLGSSGRLEIAVSGGSAAAVLGASPGTPVEAVRL